MARSLSVRLFTLAPLTLALAASLVACSTGGSPEDAEKAEASVVTPSAEPAAPQNPIPLDGRGCVDLSRHHPTPIKPAGRLVITYIDEEREKNACAWDDETKGYWCPTPTATSAECADVHGTIWCPEANPAPERLGDPQELASFELGVPGSLKIWTKNTVHEAELDISPDKKRVVYAVRSKMDAFNDEDGMGIWVSDIDGQNARKVIDRAGYTGIPTWLPPGNDRFTYLADGLHVFDLTTNTSTDVTIDGFDAGYVIDPEASHDGKRITFKGHPTGKNKPDIYVMDFDGVSKGTNLKKLTSGYSDHDPVFTRDNSKILFERYYGPGEWNNPDDLDKIEHPEINMWGIVEVDPVSGAERVLIPHDKCGKHYWWLPTVSPDGKHMMFIHDFVGADDGYQDLWISDLDGGNAQPVEGTRHFHWFDWE